MAIGHQPDELQRYTPTCIRTVREVQRAPAFLVTVDAECDNAWACGTPVTTANAAFLPRFQAVCEMYGLRPTYFTTFEMATSPVFQEFGRDLLRRRAGEIGMHLNAWNSPPLLRLTDDDAQYHPYLTEYHEPVMGEKIVYLTDLLQETFGVQMRSHRAGRWGFNAAYARLLVEHGYQADCSVTPLISWVNHPGDPRRRGGPDFRDFPLRPYFLNLEDISRPGISSLLEIPVTAMELQQPKSVERYKARLREGSIVWRVMNRAYPPRCVLIPTKRNIGSLLRTVKTSLEEKRPCVQFAIHSSHLMPGGSPTFPRPHDVEALYENLHELFSMASVRFRGATVGRFREEFQEAYSALAA